MASHSLQPARIVICMGVSSCGKTVTGQAIASRFNMPFLDADGFHSQANKDKMRAGIPLTDEDRWPWLAGLAHALHDAAAQSGMAIGACSALKRVYRDYLIAEAGEPILFVYLKGTQALIAERIAKRHHEYMPASLLPSQFATLEEPTPDENALTEPVTLSVDEITDRVVAEIGKLKAARP
jgi:carbohydrate kinase (thermoresistant glucokinase family)